MHDDFRWKLEKVGSELVKAKIYFCGVVAQDLKKVHWVKSSELIKERADSLYWLMEKSDLLRLSAGKAFERPYQN